LNKQKYFYFVNSLPIPESNGGFFKDRKEQACGFTNPADEKRLWDICEKLLNN